VFGGAFRSGEIRPIALRLVYSGSNRRRAFAISARLDSQDVTGRESILSSPVKHGFRLGDAKLRDILVLSISSCANLVQPLRATHHPDVRDLIALLRIAEKNPRWRCVREAAVTWFY